MDILESFPREWGKGEDLSGIETTFTGDFAIANDCGGAPAVRDTFRRAMREWGRDVDYMINLACALNYHACRAYERGQRAQNELYCDLHDKVREHVYGEKTPFTEAERKRFFRLTD